MSAHYLTYSFDIHGGGMDLIFPHHENEIAQSCAACSHSNVSYWMHNGFVTENNEKMSKSLGNFFTIRDVSSESHSPLSQSYIFMPFWALRVCNLLWGIISVVTYQFSCRLPKNTIRWHWDFSWWVHIIVLLSIIQFHSSKMHQMTFSTSIRYSIWNSPGFGFLSDSVCVHAFLYIYIWNWN